jgi:hypothetical protein
MVHAGYADVDRPVIYAELTGGEAQGGVDDQPRTAVVTGFCQFR